jgi:DNA-binding beta-propeller fold protein YncE
MDGPFLSLVRHLQHLYGMTWRARTWRTVARLPLAALLMLGGCDDDAGAAFDGGAFFVADAGALQRPDGGFGPPPEVEIEVSFDPPAVGATVLYATNPAASRVAVVSAVDFSIETVAVGAGALPAVAAPGRDVAISLNRAARSATVLRTTETGTTPSTVALTHEADRVAFRSDGRYAVLFEGPSGTRTNFQDLTVLDLDATEATRVVVGFGPSRVFFGPDDRAFVITEDGVSVLDLAALDGGQRPVLLSFGERVADATVTADGRFAVGQIPSEGELRQLDLETGVVEVADMAYAAAAAFEDPGGPDAGVPDAGMPPDGGPPRDAGPPPINPLLAEVSDVDLDPGSAFAMAVLRNAERAVRVPIGEGFADPEAWDLIDLRGGGVGSLVLSEAGDLAVGFTSALDVLALTVFDLGETIETRTIPLRKTVRTVALSADGTFALVLHRPGEGNLVDVPDEAQRIARSDGFSLVDIASGFVRLSLTPATPQPDGVALEPSGEFLFLALRNDLRGVQSFQAVNLATFAVDAIALTAPPTSLGTFPDLERAFVGQEADGGRVTFYDWRTRERQTIAGFELGAGIRR